jgi:hypothetical protein
MYGHREATSLLLDAHIESETVMQRRLEIRPAADAIFRSQCGTTYRTEKANEDILGMRRLQYLKPA